MGVLTDNGFIREISSGSSTSLAYVLDHNSDFSLTEYKVLQSQNNRVFIKCMQLLYNGKIEINYLTTGYRTFTSMLPSLSSTELSGIITHLLNAIIEVKNNGFLSYQNIDITLDRIFVTPDDLSVGLVYVPISLRVKKDFSSFESELRGSLGKLISTLPTFHNPLLSQLYADLSNGALTLEALVIKRSGISALNNELSDTTGSVMTLVALNAPSPLELVVNKDEYAIGKSRVDVDGVILFNQAISRFHCKIIRANGQYWLEDLGSLNGTSLNKVRLQPNTRVAVKNGDIIQIANTNFEVCMR